MPTPQVHVFLPQIRMPLEAIVERARVAEASGFDGMAFMDHLTPPMANHQPMWEAITLATWVAAHTERLTIGHLVLCDLFRHPSDLARQVSTIDHASGGRFELGIGSGSVPEELATFGYPSTTARERVRRLDESLTVMRALWTGEIVDHEGELFRLDGAQQLPATTRPIPITIGGTGPRTMEVVARHADWWNVPVHHLDRLDETRERAGDARVSVQIFCTAITDDAPRDEILAETERRFPFSRGSAKLEGNGPELVDQIGALAERGIERVSLWFTDFAQPATLEWFGANVLADLD